MAFMRPIGITNSMHPCLLSNCILVDKNLARRPELVAQTHTSICEFFAMRIVNRAGA